MKYMVIISHCLCKPLNIDFYLGLKTWEASNNPFEEPGGNGDGK